MAYASIAFTPAFHKNNPYTMKRSHPIGLNGSQSHQNGVVTPDAHKPFLRISPIENS